MKLAILAVALSTLGVCSRNDQLPDGVPTDIVKSSKCPMDTKPGCHWGMNLSKDLPFVRRGDCVQVCPCDGGYNNWCPTEIRKAKN